MSEQVADLLEDTADYIEKHGWTQGTFEGLDGSVCLVGGMDKALLRWDGPVQAQPLMVNLMYQAVWHTLGGSRAKLGGLTFWNDMPERTEQEVLDTLRKAAKDERGSR